MQVIGHEDNVVDNRVQCQDIKGLDIPERSSAVNDSVFPAGTLGPPSTSRGEESILHFPQESLLEYKGYQAHPGTCT